MEYNVVWLSSIFPSRFTLYSFLPRMTITGVACSFLPASFTREQREDWVMRWTDHLPARCVMAVTPTSTHTHTCSGSLLCLWSQVLFSFPDLLGTERMVCLAGLGPTIFFFLPSLKGAILEKGNVLGKLSSKYPIFVLWFLELRSSNFPSAMYDHSSNSWALATPDSVASLNGWETCYNYFLLKDSRKSFIQHITMYWTPIMC